MTTIGLSATRQAQELLNKDVNTCPVCKSDRYLNPNLKLLVSPCFHKICESCIQRIFTRGPAPCPLCKTILRKQNFVVQTFEDLYVEKEVQIRKRIARTFNKRLEDFKGNARAYNDYLEDVETILFNLLNGVDVAQTQERISKYEKENKELIKKNIQRQLIEDKVTFSKFERERKERQMRKEAWQNAVIEEAKMKKNAKNEIIKQIAANPNLLDSNPKESKKKFNELVNNTKRMKLDLMTLLDAQLKNHPDAKLLNGDDDDDDDIYSGGYGNDNNGMDITGNATGSNDKSKAFIGFSRPLDYDYKPENLPAIMDNYIDPWLKPLKIDNRDERLKLDGYGFSPSFVFEKAIHSTYDSLFVGI